MPRNILKATAFATIVAASPVNATQDKIICETRAICDKLSNVIQTQINELEAKDNLNNDDKKLRYNLQKQLIALEKSETAINENLITAEKSETAQNNRVIAEELRETAEVQKTDSRLRALETALSLENN
jgi:NCAIR mutase (PurE)-related protein